MDPQQRLLLEVGYEAQHSVDVCREDALNTGIFLGIMNADWAARSTERLSVYDATSGAISIAAGRISFVLGMQGPCCSYDTACSSALIALHETHSRPSQPPERARAGGGSPTTTLDPVLPSRRVDAVNLTKLLDSLLQRDDKSWGWRCQVFDAVFAEVVLQVGVHCAERGELLNRLRKFYAKLAVQLEEKEVPLQRTREKLAEVTAELEREQTA